MVPRSMGRFFMVLAVFVLALTPLTITTLAASLDRPDSLLIVSDGRINVKFEARASNPESAIRRFLERSSFVEYRDAAGNLVSRAQPTFSRDSARLTRRMVRVHLAKLEPMFPKAGISDQARESFAQRGITHPEAIFDTSPLNRWHSVTLAERDVDLAEIALRLGKLPEVEYAMPASWPPAQVERIDSKLHAAAFEDRFESPGHIHLRLYTEQAYGCTNYGILTDVRRQGQRIVLRALGVVRPGGCLEEMGSASTNVDLGRLDPGIHRLRVIVGGDTTDAHVSINDQTIDLFGSSTVLVDRSVLHRIPENLIWGDAMGMGDTQAVRDFVAALRRAGAAEVRLAAGDYEYFEIRADGTRVFDCAREYCVPFLFAWDGKPEALADVLASYRSRVRINLFTARGERLGNGAR
jgi:hypothetical protein